MIELPNQLLSFPATIDGEYVTINCAIFDAQGELPKPESTTMNGTELRPCVLICSEAFPENPQRPMDFLALAEKLTEKGFALCVDTKDAMKIQSMLKVPTIDWLSFIAESGLLEARFDVKASEKVTNNSTIDSETSTIDSKAYEKWLLSLLFEEFGQYCGSWTHGGQVFSPGEDLQPKLDENASKDPFINIIKMAYRHGCFYALMPEGRFCNIKIAWK